MDYVQIIRQAMVVPTIIQEGNKDLAAAHRLRQRAALPNAEGAVDLCGRVITATVTTMEAGELDALFGGWSDLNTAVAAVSSRLPEGLPERETRHATEMLLTALNHWAETHDKAD